MDSPALVEGGRSTHKEKVQRSSSPSTSGESKPVLQRKRSASSHSMPMYEGFLDPEHHVQGSTPMQEGGLAVQGRSRSRSTLSVSPSLYNPPPQLTRLSTQGTEAVLSRAGTPSPSARSNHSGKPSPASSPSVSNSPQQQRVTSDFEKWKQEHVQEEEEVEEQMAESPMQDQGRRRVDKGGQTSGTEGTSHSESSFASDTEWTTEGELEGSPRRGSGRGAWRDEDRGPDIDKRESDGEGQEEDGSESVATTTTTTAQSPTSSRVSSGRSTGSTDVSSSPAYSSTATTPSSSSRPSSATGMPPVRPLQSDHSPVEEGQQGAASPPTPGSGRSRRVQIEEDFSPQPAAGITFGIPVAQVEDHGVNSGSTPASLEAPVGRPRSNSVGVPSLSVENAPSATNLKGPVSDRGGSAPPEKSNGGGGTLSTSQSDTGAPTRGHSVSPSMPQFNFNFWGGGATSKSSSVAPGHSSVRSTDARFDLVVSPPDRASPSAAGKPNRHGRSASTVSSLVSPEHQEANDLLSQLESELALSSSDEEAGGGGGGDGLGFGEEDSLGGLSFDADLLGELDGTPRSPSTRGGNRRASAPRSGTPDSDELEDLLRDTQDMVSKGLVGGGSIFKEGSRKDLDLDGDSVSLSSADLAEFDLG